MTTRTTTTRKTTSPRAVKPTTAEARRRAATANGDVHHWTLRNVRAGLAKRRFEHVAREISSYVEEVERLPLPALEDHQESRFQTLPPLFESEFQALDERRRRSLVLFALHADCEACAGEGTPASRAMLALFAAQVARIATATGGRWGPMDTCHEYIAKARLDLVVAGRTLDIFNRSEHASAAEWDGNIEGPEFFLIMRSDAEDPKASHWETENTTSAGHDEMNSHLLLFPRLAGAINTVTEKRMHDEIDESERPRIMRVRLQFVGEVPNHLQPIPHDKLAPVDD